MIYFYTYFGPPRSERMLATVSQNYAHAIVAKPIEELVLSRLIEFLELEIEFKEDHERRHHAGVLLNLSCPLCQSKIIFMDRDYWLICPYCEYSIERNSTIVDWVTGNHPQIIAGSNDVQAPINPFWQGSLCNSYFLEIRKQLKEYLAKRGLKEDLNYFVV